MHRHLRLHPEGNATHLAARAFFKFAELALRFFAVMPLLADAFASTLAASLNLVMGRTLPAQ